MFAMGCRRDRRVVRRQFAPCCRLFRLLLSECAYAFRSLPSASASLHADVGFVHPLRFVGRLEMPSQSLLQLRAVILHPAPDRCVVNVETTLLQQLLNIAHRKRTAKIPPDRTKDDAGFGLPPFEDRRSGYHFAIGSRHQPATPKAATYPPSALIYNFALRNFLAPLQCPLDR